MGTFIYRSGNGRGIIAAFFVVGGNNHLKNYILWCQCRRIYR
ncbi:hypothetical protein BACPEC_00632 [[Bacteroides] pectinophilus ATCC 43243]|uniref:Uncharacterized protein n=1 Tax=[Bacteroides] pectinophilus ATCC 43243 TaxID=483218 RepID=B7APM6_9FIRM|nr:hypothetical protein BACPEC_00632 [[Bacteroides] pectinophilus ATCC 43243]